MNKRLVTDAKIVLEKAGYQCEMGIITLYVRLNGTPVTQLYAYHATVDNDTIVELLADRGFDEFGNKKKPGD